MKFFALALALCAFAHDAFAQSKPADPLPLVVNRDAKHTEGKIVLPVKTDIKGDTIVRDTMPGLLVVADSCVRMVGAGQPGLYRYENVSAPLCVDAFRVLTYRWLVRGDGTTQPFDLTEKYFLLSGAAIDPKRILLFSEKPRSKK